jgi:hypothetical protein
LEIAVVQRDAFAHADQAVPGAVGRPVADADAVSVVEDLDGQRVGAVVKRDGWFGRGQRV